MDFPLFGVFLTVGVSPKRLLDWLEAGTTGPASVRHLDDGRMVIAIGDRCDANLLRSEFATEFDLSIVSTSGSPEKVRGFVKNIGRMDA